MDSQLSQFETVFGLLGAPIHVFSKSKRGVIGGKIASPKALQRWVSAANRPEDFYVCLNPSMTNRIKPRIEDITAFRWWLLDIDPIDPAGDGRLFDTITITNELDRMFGFHPYFYRVWSGRGRQMWIPIADNGFSAEEAQLLVKGCTEELIRRIGPVLRREGCHIDAACAEISHLARLPGTTNTKTGAVASIDPKAGPTCRAELLRVQDMKRFAAAPPEPPIVTVIPDGPISVWTALTFWNALTPFNRGFITTGVDTATESRHRRATATARQLRDIGCPSDLALSWLMDGAGRSKPRLEPSFINRLHKETFKESS